MRFPAKKMPVALKHRAISRQEKGCLGTPLPLRQNLYGRTLTSKPKFLGSIGYQIYLAMVLH